MEKEINNFTSSIYAVNELEETKVLDWDLKMLNEDYLAYQAAIFKNTGLINYIKPTSQFLKMEQRKGR